MQRASDTFASGATDKTRQTPSPFSLKFNRESVALIGIVAVLSWHHFVAHAWTLPLLAVVLLPVAIASGNRAVIHLGVLASLWFLVPRLFPDFPSLTIGRAATLAAYLYLVRCIPALRQSAGWWRVGTLRGRTLAGVGIFMGLFGLFTWWYVMRFHPGSSSRLIPPTDLGALWLVYILVGAAMNALVRCIPALRQSVGSLRGRTLAGVVIFIGILGGFTGWYVGLFHPGSSRLIPITDSGPLWLAYILAGAAINALLEEIFWRGVMYDAVVSVWGVAALALATQALQFGIAHFRGPFYSGWTGVAATALFGVWQGYLRQRTGGLLVPWLVHFGCDVVVLVCAARGD